MQINQRKYLVHITESIPTLPQVLWEVADTGFLIHVSLIPFPLPFQGFFLLRINPTPCQVSKAHLSLNALLLPPEI